MSLIYKRNTRGPRIKPFVTPAFTEVTEVGHIGVFMGGFISISIGNKVKTTTFLYKIV